MSSNENKAKTLGMPHGTANGRLKKNILFHLLKKLNENICFKCGKLIDVVDELSIEHKLPWEGRSAELFWDLNNIAFSHLFCNRPNRPHNNGGWNKKQRPEGTNWCIGHQRFEPIENFWKAAQRSSGLEQYCKETKHLTRQKKSKRFQSACGEMANAEALNPSAPGLAGSSPA
jgi:hypothetical protein